MIAYELLSVDQIRVGTLALVRASLSDAHEDDRRDYWTAVIVNRVTPQLVEVAPIASPDSATGLSESLILRRKNNEFPLYKIIVT